MTEDDKKAISSRAKLEDVARVANVSLATASRAINHPHMVSEKIRSRVTRATHILAYTPHQGARFLSSGRSYTIGAVIPTLRISVIALGVEIIQERIGAKGYTLLLGVSQYDPVKEAQHIRALASQGVDGLILVGDSFDAEAISQVRAQGIPTLSTYVCHSSNGLATVGIDNGEGSEHLVAHLLQLGHREFGIVTNSRLANDRAIARRDGALRALAQRGIVVGPHRVVDVDFPAIGEGRIAFAQLLSESPQITAVICTADALAIGALMEATRLGIRIPQDVSISGYDDMDFAEFSEPPLTSVRVPARQIGEIAAASMIRAIEDGKPPESSTLHAELVVRGSTGPVRRQPVQAQTAPTRQTG